MFDHKKFDFAYYDFHIREYAKNIISEAYHPFLPSFDVERSPEEQARLVALQDENAWTTPFSLADNEKMIILDCVDNLVFNGLFCSFGHSFEPFERLEVLFDSRYWGKELVLKTFAKGYEDADGVVYRPTIPVGDNDALEERLYRRIKEDCDEKLRQYMVNVVDGGRI